MTTSHDTSSIGRSVAFIGRLLLRSLGLALLGAVAGALIGAFNGAWLNMLARTCSDIGPKVRSCLDSGTFVDVLWASYVGAASSAITLFIASLIAWKANISDRDAGILLWSAAKGATVGVLVSAVLMIVNFVLFSWLTTRRTNFQEMLSYSVSGVIAGFILGLFYFVLHATLREVMSATGGIGSRDMKCGRNRPHSVD
jgi:hypothetical protein